jgi:hypothetical protein
MTDISTILIPKYRSIFGIQSLLLQTNNNTLNTTLSGNISIYSNLNISSNTILINSNTITTNLFVNNNLNVSGNTSFLSILNTNNSVYNGNVTILSNLNSTSISILYGSTIVNTNLSAATSFHDSITILSNLNISNNTTIPNLSNILNNLTINNNSIFNSISINSNLNILKDTIFNNSVSNLSNLYINGYSIINNQINSSFLSVTGTSNFNNISFLSNLNVEGNCYMNNSINNSITVGNSMNISGTTKINTLNILGQIVNNLPEYADNDSATNGGVPLWGFYRTGGIIKIRINTITSVLTLNGSSTMNLYLDDIFNDPGANITDTSNDTISVVGTVTVNNIGSYIVYYSAIDSYGNIINTISRTVNIIPYPIIVSIILVSNQVIVTISGTYDLITYFITNNNNIIKTETQISSTTISVASLTTNTIPYIITINLKRSNGNILTTNSLSFTI